MNRRSTPEADAQRAIVQALRFALPRDAIVHHCVNEVTEAGPRGARRQSILVGMGVTPDWLPGVVPRCVPMETKNNQHGERAPTIVVGTERVKSRGKWRTVEVLACPVTWRPHPEQIASTRRGYEDWWQALDWIQDGLLAGGMLQDVDVTAAMPKLRPWA